VWNTPIAGIGQGNGAGPHIWAAVSLPIFEVMHEDGFYAYMIASISNLEKKRVSFPFVDDTDLCIYEPHIQQNNVLTQMQGLVDNWEGILQATGGTLVPDKCFWYWIDFKLVNHNWEYVTKQEKPGELTTIHKEEW